MSAPPSLAPFEQVIDGYFPLRVSLGHMLARLGVDLAYVEITHAPMLQVPGLAHDAPVPLNIRAGKAGIIDRLHLRVACGAEGVALSGVGAWRWLDGSVARRFLDPMTRLAEPAFLRGFYASEGGLGGAQVCGAKDAEGGLAWGPFETSGVFAIRAETVEVGEAASLEYVRLGSPARAIGGKR